MTVTRATPRLHSLTGLRFLAAFGVFIGHAYPTAAFIPLAMMSVSFFFVLSGFVITWSAREKDTVPQFWRRRFWKVFPNHVATWASMLAVIAITGVATAPGFGGGDTPQEIPTVANLLLVHTWLPVRDLIFSVNPVSWSLASELAFYLLFPLLFPVFARVRAAVLPVLLVGVIALVWAVPLVSMAITGPPVAEGQLDEPMLRFWFVYYFPLSRLPEFLLGVVLARMVRGGFTPRLGVLPGMALAAAALAVTPLLPMPFSVAALSVVPVALMVVGAASADVRGVRTVWRARPMVFLGEISFALYLSHYQILLLFDLYAGETVRRAIGPAPTVLLLTVVCTLVAWGMFAWIEQPLMRRFGTTPRSRGASPPGTREPSRAGAD
ncbi:acyltransferase family protein [Streptomyces anulatus]|uniref:acyltransferase family protein n=1 Tax=Streptomyces anulatus TaxID=1892 RepID=UPI002259F19A|nr:acyltransferase [Streptomyces anulatus]MCX4505773.1 acyltransferase [Streptomyces anulatus]WSU72283.1 acyltransferase [Streptomyces anulatus]